MRRALLLAPILTASCTITQDEPIVLECMAPDPGLYVGQTVRWNAQIAGRPPGQFPEEYSWTLTGIPDGANVLLDRADERDPTFVPDVPGTYTAEVNVVDFDGTEGGPCEVSYDVAPEPLPCGDGTFSNEYQAGECPPELVLYVISGTFGYDAGRQSAVPYTAADGTHVPVTVQVDLYDGFFTPYCGATLTVDGELPQASYVSSLPDAGYFGFTMPADATIDTDCDGAGLDPALFTDTPSTYLQTLGFGLAVAEMPAGLAGDLENFVVGNTSQQVWDTEWVGFVIGGGAHIAGYADNYPAAWFNIDYGFGYELSADGSVAYEDDNDSGTYDDGEPYVTLPASTTLESGAYELFGGYAMDARCGFDPLLCPADAR